ncbi:PAS domain-containing sensor histidine kinase [Pandoraea sp.]|uniref:PAS domain-containing sensor histidine kinase n=1 Tax=Pandoraea sp. TaxID=1883445 RepID=UPI00122126B0|nr:PAS domain-containing sensor histidine kinase [Pandoraea sp.]TAL53188.1 MAG: PAS domain-containing sensor histidine kinase [Pandoraea sp.]TAM20604.1 MAG: PAS domain-containing sensor histidine kinase [Pandoraea sp.]
MSDQATEPLDTTPTPPHVPADENFRLLVEAVGDYAIFRLDPAGNVASWNPGARKLKGYEAAEILGRHFSVFHSPEDVNAGQPALALATAAAQGRYESEGWRVRKDGSKFWANVIITAIRDEQGTLRGFAKVTQDLTERRRLAELEQIRRFSRHIQAAREEEQARIARELHDDLGQQLTALKMALADLDGMLDAHPAVAAQVAANMRDMHRLIDVGVASLRRIVAGLHPIAIETLGLVPALDWLTEDFSRRYGIAVEFRAALGELPLSDAAAATLFHIIQEALTNVARHARASQVIIDLAARDGACLLHIEDNGQGMRSEARANIASFGLMGMRERVGRLDGTLVIDGAPGRGVRIAIAIPLAGIVAPDASGR